MGTPLLWLTLFCSSSLAYITTCAGIRLELTHVDAKANCTIQERLRRAMARTHHRLASMDGVTAPVHWNGTQNGGQYIAEYLIGDPPQPAEAIIDTGSNLIWTQCSACRRRGCFNQSLPYYDPSMSGTVQPVACSDTACALGSETQCARDRKTCDVVTSYGAGNIAGVLGTETFTFRSETERLAFGCITATKITPGALHGASGIIGLGRDGLSLVSQLGDTKFSYCLTPYFSDAINMSHLFVGPPASLGRDSPVTSVPFVKNPDEDPYSTFYYLPLAGITVGKSKLDIPEGTFELRQLETGEWTGTLIDSGSPFTTLVDVAYQALTAELARQLGASLVPPPAGTETSDLCVAKGDVGKLVPPLVLDFKSGGDLVVPPENYWAPVDDTKACMVVFRSEDMTIIGNYMTQDMHLLYDLGEGILSFQPADCSSM